MFAIAQINHILFFTRTCLVVVQVFSLSVWEMGTLLSLGPTDSCEFFHDPFKGRRLVLFLFYLISLTFYFLRHLPLLRIDPIEDCEKKMRVMLYAIFIGLCGLLC